MKKTPTAIVQITGSKSREKVPTSILEADEADMREGERLIAESKRAGVKEWLKVMAMFLLLAVLIFVVVFEIKHLGVNAIKSLMAPSPVEVNDFSEVVR